MDQARDDEAAIAGWLIADARLCQDPVAIIGGFCARLIGQGVPLWRLRAGQALANPLASAWGVIWTRDGAGTHEYRVPRATLSTRAYHGSPFQHVVERRATFRRRLVDLDLARDHAVLHEMAAAGGTDYLALPLEYGDGSVQGVSLVSDAPEGFADWHLALIERLRQPLAAALEPTAMRRSTAILLRTFLGDGPADAVLAGAFRRGDRRQIEAAILLCDLRGFTTLSERLGEADLFAALDRYFEAVVEAVRAEGGDVLKFLGDGILAMFPVEAAGSRAACGAALRAVEQAGERLAGTSAGDGSPLAFVAALHLGEVAYGNIGSPERLDFTVLGPAGNLASRLEGLAKQLGQPLLCSAAFAGTLDVPITSLGSFPLKGVAQPQEVFVPQSARQGS
jgi:adenylate cyclase